jgi:hypothetical protein
MDNCKAILTSGYCKNHAKQLLVQSLRDLGLGRLVYPDSTVSELKRILDNVTLMPFRPLTLTQLDFNGYTCEEKTWLE